MKDKHIIIILLVIIAVLALAVGVMLMNPGVSKEPVKIKITSDKSQYEGEVAVSVLLCDLNKTPLTKEPVNISVCDDKGKVVVDNVLKTNSKGKAKLDLDLKKGKYTVNVAYGGNENYTANNTTQKLTIKEEEVVEATVSDSNYNREEQIDYNSPNSEYFKSETDGKYYKKQPGVDYVYTQDAITGEWSYWADKSK